MICVHIDILRPYTSVHTYIHTCTHMLGYIDICMYVCIYIHIHIHVYMRVLRSCEGCSGPSKAGAAAHRQLGRCRPGAPGALLRGGRGSGIGSVEGVV